MAKMVGLCRKETMGEGKPRSWSSLVGEVMREKS